MVTRRLAWIAVAGVLAGGFAYLHDPPWLINQTSGLRGWERHGSEPRYRWSGAHASFFVRADAAAIEFPVSTTFDARDARPMLLTVSVDDRPATRFVISDAAWRRVRVVLPPPGSRRLRRIDVRTSVTRESNHGVRIGDVEYVPRH